MQKDTDLFGKYIQSIMSNDINVDNLDIELLDEAEFEIMNQNNNYGIKEFLTVISLNDNPNLNLEVAQPCKYKIDKKITTGIICYTLDALDVLKGTIKPSEKIVKVGVKTKECKILDLCSYKDKQRLRDVYTTIAQEELEKRAKRQAEGIAVAKAKGVYKGRKPIQLNQKELELVYIRWKAGEITARQAMSDLNIKPNTFYRRIKEYEASKLLAGSN